MMKKQNKIYLTIGIVAVVLIAAIMMFSTPKGENDNSNTVKIRFTGPLSGAFAYYGTQAQKGLNLAFEDYDYLLNEKNLVLDIKYEDNTGDKTKAVTDFNTFLSGDNVALVISTNTPLSQPLIPLAEQNNINLLALITGAKDFAKDTNYVFRDAIMSYDEGVLLGNYFNQQDYSNIATLVVNDDYGLSGALGVKDELEKNGKTIVAEEVFENSATDVRTQINKIKEKNPDAIFLVGRESNLIIAIQQMIELGIPQEKIFSIDSFESPTVLNGLDSLANGIKITSVYYDLNNLNTKKFFDEFKEKYDADPGIYAIDAYSAGEYIIQSVVDCGTSSEQINDCFTTKEFETIKGNISFNNLHDMSITVGLFEIENKSKILIEKLK
ncbi:MAG: penicillin-binding protein activator [Candidatus Woesearchaeota archaeon]